jgi:hypothetical protein
MPAYRFSWDAFDDRTVLALATDIGFSGSPDDARGYLTTHVMRLDEDVVRSTRNAVATHWLTRHERVAAGVARRFQYS